MKNDIFSILSQEFEAGQYIRLQGNEKLRLYVGRNNKGLFTFEFRGQHVPTRIVGSEVITVQQTKSDSFYSLGFSLSNPDLLEYFCTFCEDLLYSTREIFDDNTAYKTLCSRYFSWKKLFKPNSARLSEFEIMGLIGELLFLRDNMFPKYGLQLSLDSWTGPEMTHKDFSLDDTWYEVKTISSGKGTVKISSIEQLDSDLDGVLAIYELEKMSPSFNGLNVNKLVSEIMNILKAPNLKDFFSSKLGMFGYDFSPEYENYVFSKTNFKQYNVDDNFPKLKRKDIPSSIQKIQYEIVIPDIDEFEIK